MRKLVAIVALLLGIGIAPTPAYAATATVGLGTAATYSVLGGQTVTNTGPSTLAGGVGVAPGSAITGFPPGQAAFKHAADAQAGQAQSDLTTAYNDAAGRPSTAGVAGDLVGRTLVDGVYTASSSLLLSGTLTLDGQGNSNSVWIFQIGSTLTTASASHVNLINGALACNVFWQIGSSATLGTNSQFVGTILALTSITVTTGVTVEGRALARNGATTLDSNVFTNPNCQGAPTTTTRPAVTTTRPPATTAPATTAPATTRPAVTTRPAATTVPATTPTTRAGCGGCPTTTSPAPATTKPPLTGGGSSSAPPTTCNCVDDSTTSTSLLSIPVEATAPCVPGSLPTDSTGASSSSTVARGDSRGNDNGRNIAYGCGGAVLGACVCGAGSWGLKKFRR